MKYVYCMIFVLGLGFLVSVAEQKLGTAAFEDFHSKHIGEVIDPRETNLSNEVTSAQIKEPYETRFEKLQTEALEEVSNLIEVAIDDYRTKKSNGETISYLYFFQTYYPQVKQLESTIDDTFLQKFTQLEEELAYYGYSPEKAAKFKEQFEQVKQEQLKEVKNRVWELF